MAYIHNGKVVDKKPFTLKGFLIALWSALALFVHTFLSLQPMSQAIEDYQHPTPGAAQGGLANTLRRLFNRGGGHAVGGGGGRAGGDSGWAAAVNRRGRNIHSLPKAPISGGCNGGG